MENFKFEEEEESSKILIQDQTIKDISEEILTEHPDLPEELPILPLRGVVVYPHTAVPLTIGQPRSVKLVDEAVAGSRLIGLVASKKPELETPGPEDLYNFGTISAIQRLFRAPDGTIRLIVQGLGRFELGEFITLEPFLAARIILKPEMVEEGVEIEAQVRAARDQFQRITELTTSLPPEIVGSVLNLEDPLHVAYSIANFQRMDLEEAQSILEEDSAIAKLKTLNVMLSREVEVLSLGQQIQQEARSEIEKVQREYFLREQLKAIQRELGEVDEQAAEVEEFRSRIESAIMPEEAEKQAKRELDRLAKLPTAAAEYGVIRTYLDWLVSLPWSTASDDNLDLGHAREVLDEDHYGLEDVKERILEYLAVRKLRSERREEIKERRIDAIRQEREGVILCFIGPPGVGKTSLGQSIARAMGRKFIRMSLGGIHDEAEIRGHRRTYIGAMPGRILQAIRRVESRNPVFMLDEVDKLGRDFRGDPASALLELLDPEQNREFRDHYLEVAFDMSQVMFITTANWIETIPAPLLDRMEVIRLSGYTESEKVAIAKGYLIPRQIRENGLRSEEFKIEDQAITQVIRNFTREAGVRNLEREIGRLCRKVATRIAEDNIEHVEIDDDDLVGYLGTPKFLGIEEIEERTEMAGVATGLAWTPTGGDVLFIEATAMDGGKNFQLTGQLGEVMQESARAALSYIRSISDKLKIPKEYWGAHDIHLHVPAGAQPKDGPSAGVTMAVTLASMATGRPVRCEVGMTGEITLRGKVLPVGGIKEKILAAHRFHLEKVILPRRNEADLEDVPEDVRKNIQFIFADTVEDVINAALKPVSRRRAKKTDNGDSPGQGSGGTKSSPRKSSRSTTSKGSKP
jgi:ATP-dependent Lon protease